MIVDDFQPSTEQLQLLSLLESGLVPPTVANPDFVRRICTESSEQSEWIPILLRKVLGDELVPTVPMKARYEFLTIFSLIKKATRSPYTAKVSIRIPFLNKVLKLSVASPNARYPGAISLVYDESGYGYVGSIGLDHSVTFIKRGREIKEQLIDVLMGFEAAPITLLQGYALKHDRCPFCEAKLQKTDIAIGYDLGCAQRYELPTLGNTMGNSPVAASMHPSNFVQVSIPSFPNPFDTAIMQSMLDEYDKGSRHGY